MFTNLTEIEKKQKAFYENLAIIKSKRKSANDIKKNSCQLCGLCCYSMPCDLEYSDIEKIADYLQITRKDLFLQFLIIQPYPNMSKYTLIPIRKKQQDIAGQFKPISRWFDMEPCIFLDEENKCTIEEVKPKGGLNMQCWDNKYTLESGIFHTKEEIVNIQNEFNK